MPSAGFPTAHGTTSSMFTSSATSGTSIFDSWGSKKSKKSSTPIPTTPDTASIRSTSTTANLLSPIEQKAHAQGRPRPLPFPLSQIAVLTPRRAASQPPTMSLRSIATRGWERRIPRYQRSERIGMAVESDFQGDMTPSGGNRRSRRRGAYTWALL